MITVTKTTKTTKTYLGGRVIVEKETKSFGGKIYTIKGPLVKKNYRNYENKKVMVLPSLFYFFMFSISFFAFFKILSLSFDLL